MNDSFQLNFPVNESPLFHIPEAPELTQTPSFISQSQAHKRPPVPGYDMKTLRKQVEYLHQVSLFYCTV